MWWCTGRVVRDQLIFYSEQSTQSPRNWEHILHQSSICTHKIDKSEAEPREPQQRTFTKDSQQRTFTKDSQQRTFTKEPQQRTFNRSHSSVEYGVPFLLKTSSFHFFCFRVEASLTFHFRILYKLGVQEVSKAQREQQERRACHNFSSRVIFHSSSSTGRRPMLAQILTYPVLIFLLTYLVHGPQPGWFCFLFFHSVPLIDLFRT